MISGSLGAAFVAGHLSAVESEVAGFVPASGRSPTVVLLELGDPAGERVAAALRARCVELRTCEVLGRPVAWAIVTAGTVAAVVAVVDSGLALRLAASMEPVCLPECRLVVVGAGGACARMLLLGRGAA